MDLLSQKYQEAWNEGRLHDAYRFMGAHPQKNGVQFCVWAPHAKAISVVGDFNDWNAKRHRMKPIGEGGFWRRSIKSATPGQYYKYAITGPDGSTILKSDPFAFFGENEGQHASVIYQFPDFSWHDENWLDRRQHSQQPDQPLSVYEVHLGSWRHENWQPLSYRQLAEQLIPYVEEMGFTHIELLPVMEHPFTPSWGYQITGYYAPTSRFGPPEDFMFFVDECHRRGIGVILDWVPGHFPKDEYGLRFFDGEPLFEHPDPRRHEHGDWGTHNFDFDNPGVRSFLLSNAMFWCDRYHVDGFRVDAVASMLYLDYSKDDNDWLPNEYGGQENIGAITFMRDLNELMEEKYPAVITVAEESTAWNGVTAPTNEGGLGFDYKWNMGWMNDTLYYFGLSPEHRNYESHSITFPRTFAFSERFILPFSHDEVVHLKKSLWSKMPGYDADKFKQLRLLYLYMMGYPGKKLLFMGSELAEKEEWAADRSLNWHLLNDENHKKIQTYVQTLLHMLQAEPALYEGDHMESTFEWTDLSRKEEGVFVFRRRNKSGNNELSFIFNFSNRMVSNYCIESYRQAEKKLFFDSLQPEKQAEEREPVTWPIQLQPFQGLMLK